MRPDDSLATHLAELSESLDDPRIDLGSGLRRLSSELQLAVSSYLGLSLTVRVGADEVAISEPGQLDPAQIRSSVRMPRWLLGAHHAKPNISMTFYAASPGAFVDLAADLAWSAGRQLSEIVLDDHLVPPANSPGGGLAALSSIQQAIGVLVALGRTPEQAERNLTARARRAGTSRFATAASLLDAHRAADRAQRPPD